MASLKYDANAMKHMTMRFSVQKIDFYTGETKTTNLGIKECKSQFSPKNTYYCPQSLEGIELEGDMDSTTTS